MSLENWKMDFGFRNQHSSRVKKMIFPKKSIPKKPQVTRKKKLLPPQAFSFKTKLLHGSAAGIAPLEMQNRSDQLSNNILLLRGVGSLDDRWDRYCALRQVGKASYVRGRNWISTGLDRFGEGTKAGTANSDFIASQLTNGPRTAPKISIFPPKRQH